METLNQIINEITEETPESRAEKKRLEKEMIEKFIVNRDDSEEAKTLSFAKAILSLELQIKELKDDIRAIKEEAKEEGVPVGKVAKALANLKRLAKADILELRETEDIQVRLIEDVEVKSLISQLVAKP